MLPAVVQGATHSLGPPPNWDEAKDGHCATLRVKVEMVEGRSYITSAWEPTPEEIVAIMNGAPVLLTLVHNTQPPVNLTVGAVPE